MNSLISNSKTDLWIDCDSDCDYQLHVTCFSIDSTSEPEDSYIIKRINIKYLEKEKKFMEGGFNKIYSADWPQGHIYYWDIENQEWERYSGIKVALKSLDNSYID
ncbi:kinase-like domain-containing protein [Rhizophagus clarus]|uniref:Kinase-like domain-containing protein n=1 Tax=Rhizophagus clarus TaxID=94130 RepID=A0A8H3QSG3_9GLOM|nr:kinase-like domain-containing protein [Rhizophagus clarus]